MKIENIFFNLTKPSLEKVEKQGITGSLEKSYSISKQECFLESTEVFSPYHKKVVSLRENNSIDKWKTIELATGLYTSKKQG